MGEGFVGEAYLEESLSPSTQWPSDASQLTAQTNTTPANNNESDIEKPNPSSFVFCHYDSVFSKLCGKNILFLLEEGEIYLTLFLRFVS